MKQITLVATIGTSPAVLTEAYYVLYKERRLLANKIIIVTTKIGREMIYKELLDASHGKMLALFKDLQLSLDCYPKIKLKVPKCNAEEIIDIRNKQEDEAFASLLIDVLRDNTQEESNPVYGLLSGGRKTMSAHLHSVFQLMGRSEDKLIHVLVNPEFEVEGFYYPKKGKIILNNDQELNTAEAEIEMVESPFIALRNLIKPPLDFTRPFYELVEVARKRLKSNQYSVESMYIELSNRLVYINNFTEPLRMPPRPLSILGLFGLMNKHYDKVCTLSYRSLVEDEKLLQVLSDLYHFITNKDMELDPWFKKKSGSMMIQEDSNLFARSRNELIRKLDHGLKIIGVYDFGGPEIFINDHITNRDNTASSNKLLVPGTAIYFKEEDFIKSLIQGESSK